MFVYLIFDPFSRLTKIGKSINPNKRLATIRISNPNAELFFYSKDYTEKQLHEKFKDKREQGEWFALDKNDLYSITKSFSCIPKRLHYINTKIDILRRKKNDRINNLINYVFIYRYKHDNKYKWSECGKLINTQRGKEVRKIINGGSVGYCLNGRFISTKRLRSEIELIPNELIPF